MNPLPSLSSKARPVVGPRVTYDVVSHRQPATLDELPSLAGLGDPARYLADHSRSFRFSAALMPAQARARVVRVYAWCRYTDNLADDNVSAEVAERRLDGWLRLSWTTYDGRD